MRAARKIAHYTRRRRRDRKTKTHWPRANELFRSFRSRTSGVMSDSTSRILCILIASFIFIHNDDNRCAGNVDFSMYNDCYILIEIDQLHMTFVSIFYIHSLNTNRGEPRDPTWRKKRTEWLKINSTEQKSYCRKKNSIQKSPTLNFGPSFISTVRESIMGHREVKIV